ncbi:MAG: AsnC family transcriptional regulator [Streptosporangiales bacterium]|nr:AsnC family transcriptional regulator [Streptosporangiales bacterium]
MTTTSRPRRGEAMTVKTHTDADSAAYLDEIDRCILRHLADDGRVRLRTLASSTGLSESAVSTRIHRLQANGMVVGYHARLDPTRLGRPVQAVVRLRLTAGVEPSAFEDLLRSLPTVVNAWQIAGDADYEVWLACRDVPNLHATLVALHGGGSTDRVTNLVLNQVPGLTGSRLVEAPAP